MKDTKIRALLEQVGDKQYIWSLNPISGLWKVEREVTPETKEQWLAIFHKDEPNKKFVVSKRKPK